MHKDIIKILATDLDWWNEVKKRLEKRSVNILFKQGEIWWCNVGLNIGEEIYGKGIRLERPVLVFKKMTNSSYMGIPLTSKEKHGSWYVCVSLHNKLRTVILNQARILDKKRMINRMGTLDNDQFDKVKKRFIEFYSS